MDEILRSLPAGARVLDLGCAAGSFEARVDLVVVRADLDPPLAPGLPGFVRADAARLPFPAGAFSAVVSNHSLEHFAELEASLREIGRVLAPGGSLYIAVPDSTTVTDRLYRWLARGGGHVNPFSRADDVIALVERTAGLPHVATRVLHTSLSFLNRRNVRGRMPRRACLVGSGRENVLRILTYAFRLLDRWFGARASFYGWAFYFGQVPEPIDCRPWANVCVRCGAGHSAPWLLRHGKVRRRWLVFRCYQCPGCGATNLFTA